MEYRYTHVHNTRIYTLIYPPTYMQVHAYDEDHREAEGASNRETLSC